MLQSAKMPSHPLLDQDDGIHFFQPQQLSISCLFAERLNLLPAFNLEILLFKELPSLNFLGIDPEWGSRRYTRTLHHLTLANSAVKIRYLSFFHVFYELIALRRVVQIEFELVYTCLLASGHYQRRLICR